MKTIVYNIFKLELNKYNMLAQTAIDVFNEVGVQYLLKDNSSVYFAASKKQYNYIAARLPHFRKTFEAELWFGKLKLVN